MIIISTKEFQSGSFWEIDGRQYCFFGLFRFLVLLMLRENAFIISRVSCVAWLTAFFFSSVWHSLLNGPLLWDDLMGKMAEAHAYFPFISELGISFERRRRKEKMPGTIYSTSCHRIWAVGAKTITEKNRNETVFASKKKDGKAIEKETAMLPIYIYIYTIWKTSTNIDFVEKKTKPLFGPASTQTGQSGRTKSLELMDGRIRVVLQIMHNRDPTTPRMQGGYVKTKRDSEDRTGGKREKKNSWIFNVVDTWTPTLETFHLRDCIYTEYVYINICIHSYTLSSFPKLHGSGNA